MWMPVFHILLSIPAGILVGIQLTHSSASPADVKKACTNTAAFKTSLLGLVFVVSGIIALLSPSTGADLQVLLSLSFEVTTEMILVLIFGDGMLLLILNFFFTLEATRFFHGFFSSGN